jgi:hypothetical protein
LNEKPPEVFPRASDSVEQFRPSVFRTERHLGEWTYRLGDFRVKPSAQSGKTLENATKFFPQRAWSQCSIQILDHSKSSSQACPKTAIKRISSTPCAHGRHFLHLSDALKIRTQAS